MLGILDRFEQAVHSFHDPFLDGNEIIEEAIARFQADSTKENLTIVLEAIRRRMYENGHFMIPVIMSEDGREFTFRTLETTDGKQWLVVFTSPQEYEKGESSQILSNFIDTTLKACIDTVGTGFIINPWSQSFILTAELIQLMFQADGAEPERS